MKPRAFSLTPALSAALFVAVAMLCFVIYRDYIRSDEVETGERPCVARSSRVRERRTAQPDAGLGGGRVVVEPPAVPAESPHGGGAHTPARKATVESEEIRRPVIVGGKPAPVRTGTAGASQWYPANLAPVIAHQLLQFALASEWPAEVIARRPEFAIGILRDDALRVALVAMLRGETVAGRPVVVLGRENPAALVSCPIVFVGDLVHATDAHAAFAERAIMTVTYTGARIDDTWCDIELIWTDLQVGFVVDREALARKGIAVRDALFGLEHAWVRNENRQPVRGPRRATRNSARIELANFHSP